MLVLNHTSLLENADKMRRAKKLPIIALMLVVRGAKLLTTRKLRGIKRPEFLLITGWQLSKTYLLE
jgi:hypothetical protein